MKSLEVYRTLPGEIPSPFQVKSSIYFYKAAVPTLANCSAPRVICALKAAFTRRYKEGDEPSRRSKKGLRRKESEVLSRMVFTNPMYAKRSNLR